MGFETLKHLLNNTKHKVQVGRHLMGMALQLMWRTAVHDLSKYGHAERAIFAAHNSELRSARFGTPEYQAALAKIKPAIEHHYKVNRHHPEHHADGVAGMTLLDLNEMVADWKAATLRSKGNIRESLEACFERFHIEPQLASIIRNSCLKE